ncbi:cytochrome P450 2U1-like [Diadema antillarum]|uniref:cytochrome P450 2U1-like n=1 Tax=Diadema antillarum TaxID=105358 RepID=UPI003A8B79E5
MLEKLMTSSALALLSSSLTSALLLSSTLMLLAAYMLRNQRHTSIQNDGKAVGEIGRATVLSGGLRRLRRRLPPGPRAWPLLGNIPTLVKMGKEFGAGALTELAQRYGGVYMVRLGWPGQRLVVISDVEILREAFVKQSHVFSDRKADGLTAVSFPVEGSLAWQNGGPWKEHRRFMTSTLRTLGVGKNGMGDRIGEECGYLCDYLDELGGKPINPYQLVVCTTSNIMNAVTLSKRYDYTDPHFIKLRQNCREILDKLSNTSILNLLPFLYHTRFCKNYRLAVENMTRYVQNEVSAHRKSFNNNALRDVIDFYIKEVGRTRPGSSHGGDEGGDQEGQINENFIWRGVLDLVIAGVDSTSNLVMWTLLHLAYYPELQEKVHAQIDAVVGRDRVPTIEDRSSLPLITAITQEILRTRIGTTTVPHHTAEDTYLGDYFVPKGTQVLGNIWSMHHDPAVFEEPNKFRPSRFISESGELINLQSLKTFGIGPRKCPGEIMAQQENFLIMAILLHRYRLVFPDDEPVPNIEGNVQGMMLLPDPYRVRFVRR